MSGVLLSIACKCNVSCDNKYVGAIFFSLGLLVIIELGLNLYTGAIKSIDKSNWKTILLVLVGNLIGSQIAVFWQLDVDYLIEAKLSYDTLTLLVKAIGCGVMMCIATMIKKPLITIMCVATFILCGFEHSIANMCYMAGVYNLDTLRVILISILGNTIGAICFYRTYLYVQKQKGVIGEN